MQEDPADYVAAVYVSTLKSGLNATEIEELLGTGRKEYIDELVNISADNATNTITVLVIGADDPKTGACGSLYNIANDERLNHSIEITRGVLAGECSAILKDFFRSRRA